VRLLGVLAKFHAVRREHCVQMRAKRGDVVPQIVSVVVVHVDGFLHEDLHFSYRANFWCSFGTSLGDLTSDRALIPVIPILPFFALTRETGADKTQSKKVLETRINTG